ncbi:MAG: futalosine hydrolase [Chitinophagaceae bacterium]|nr:futalosine hydrolase [Chitinophagaceae bacterium]MDB5221426.1 futalosine hydrolase [Chitinophagaceae bacterium]
MKILLVASTQLEIEPFIKLNNNIDILICGVGIPSTVYQLTKKLLQEKYDLVIQAGIAGSFSKKIKNGDVIAVEQDVFGDIGVEEDKKFKTIFDFGFEDENKYPFKKGWLINTSEILQASHLKKVKAVTINKINDRKRQTKQLKEIFNAEVESMEGAAFHFVCLQQNISFIQVRSISNSVGERDKTKWKLKDAIENLNRELIKLVDLINKP